MFSCLSLWALFICGYQKQRSVHDASAAYHHSHQRLVTRRIDEGNHSAEVLGTILLALRMFSSCVELPLLGLVESGVSISEFNGDSTLPLFRVGVCPCTGQCLGECRLSVVDMTY